MNFYNLKSIFSEGVGNRSQFSKTSIHNDGIDFHIHDHSILDNINKYTNNFIYMGQNKSPYTWFNPNNGGLHKRSPIIIGSVNFLSKRLGTNSYFPPTQRISGFNIYMKDVTNGEEG